MANEHEEASQVVGRLTTSDLRNTAKVLTWFGTRFPERQSEAEKIRTLAASEAALAGGKDPPALFVYIVTANRASSVTNEHLDCASKRWRAHNRGAWSQPSAAVSELSMNLAATASEYRYTGEL